jgi:O-antigen/teichoic acid export membrane protein
MDSNTPPKSPKLINRLKSAVKAPVDEVLGMVVSREKQKQLLGTSLYRNALFLVFSNLAGPITNFIFWIVVARFYTTSDVGLASATCSMVVLLGLFSTIGFEFGLIRYLANSGPNAGRMVNTSLTIGALAAIVSSVIFLAGVNFFSPALAPLLQSPLYIGTFIIFTMVSNLTTLTSNAFIAQRRANFTLTNIVLSRLLQLALVIVFVLFTRSFGSIIFSMVLSWAAALLISTIFLMPRTIPGFRPIPVIDRSIVRQMINFSFTNYIANILWSFIIYVLPVMVVNLLNTESNAYFYIAWTMGGVLTTIAGATTISLFAEGSFDEKKLVADVWRCLKMTFILVIPATIIVFLLANKLLLLYGTDYSLNGTMLLRIMCISTLPQSLNSVYMSVLRVKKRTTTLILLTVVIAVITLIFSYLLLPHIGITAPGIGWLISQSVVAVYVGAKIIKLRKTGEI